MKKTLLLILLFAKIAISQTTSIILDGKEYEVSYKLKGITPVAIPVPDPIVIQTPIQTGNTIISGSRYDLLKGFVLSFKVNNQVPNQISWDGLVYWPFSVLYQEPNKTETYWLKQGNTIQKIEVKTGDNSSTPYLIGSNTPIPEPTPIPIIVDNSNQSDGEFDPNGSPVEMLNIGETYEVPIDRNVIQMSSFSFGKNGIQGMQTYLKQYGKLICYLRSNDGEVTNGGYSNNNHPMMTQIVIKGGQLEVGYKNATNQDYPIVFGLAQIANNMGYTFYYPNGLKSAFYYKQLNKNDNTVKRFNVEIENDYGWVQQKEPGSLVKDFNVNFFKDGKLYLEEMLWNGDNEFKYNVPVKANSTETRCIRSKKEGSLEVCIKINTKGYGETGTVEVISEKGGLKVSKDMVRISGYVYNYINYSAQEGIKNKDYKMYNNAGFVNELTKSIVQKEF